MFIASSFEENLYKILTFVLSSGECTLYATAERRNKKRDPVDRARVGYKVDLIVEFTGLHWKPEIGCGKVAGGLPRCSRSKEWKDTIKLAWELRDLWALTQEELAGVDASALVAWLVSWHTVII